MTGLTIEVKNLIKDLDKLPKEVYEKLWNELALTSLMIETDYKTVTPVDTGRLRSSMHVEHYKIKSFTYRDSKGNTYDGKLSYTPNQNQFIIGSNVKYANVIENGFSGSVTVKSHQRVSRNGNAYIVQSHSRNLNRRGNSALKTAFEKNTAGLLNRLLKLI
jgi:hypothetical protein